MPDLSFQVVEAQAEPYAAAPELKFHLRIAASDSAESIRNVALRCQVRIEATRRRYASDEQARLADLFGEPESWSRNLHSLLWAHVNAVVPPFADETTIKLPVPCTFDFNVATTKFFYGLDDGEIPLLFLFSGTMFYADEGGSLQVAQIPWEKEAAFRLPVAVWRQMMDIYYPNGAWLRLRRDVFDRLHEFKIRRCLPTWEQALDELLAVAAEETPA